MFKDPHPFLNSLFEEINENKLDLKDWPIDHICYRSTDLENYKIIKDYFSQRGDLLIESEVGGRPIATYKLFRPIAFKNYQIPLVEVPSPKKESSYQEGFEHIEFVIDISFERFIKSYPSLNYKTKGMDKKINPELGIIFNHGNIKLHHQSLEEVIHFEKYQKR